MNTNTINAIPSFINSSVDFIATYLVSCMFGFKPEQATVVAKSSYEEEVEELLLTIRGVGKATVKAICEDFGALRALKYIVEQDVDTLVLCKGIGESRANLLCKSLRVRGGELFNTLRVSVETEIREALALGGEEAAQALIEANSDLLIVYGERPLKVQEKIDTEVEHFFQSPRTYWEEDEHGFPTKQRTVWESYPTWVFNDTKYFTFSGEGNDMDAQYERTAAGFDPKDVRDLDGKVWTSTWNFRDKECTRNFHIIVSWIWLNQENTKKLQAGWRRFWKRFYAKKDTKAALSWLTPRQITTVKNTFKQFGVTTVAERKAARA